MILQPLILIKGFHFDNVSCLRLKWFVKYGFYVRYYKHLYLFTFKETDIFLGSSKSLCPPRCISHVVVIVVVMIGHSTKNSMT